jgi:hypothetical protein
LSSAVVAELVQGFDEVLEIEIAISASNQASLGRSVHAALLSYAGKAIRVRRFGAWTTARALRDWCRIDIAVPGKATLRARRVALCEVPDMELLPARYPALRKMAFRAGTELSILNRGAGLLAWLTAAGLVRKPAALVGIAGRAAGLLHRFVPA